MSDETALPYRPCAAVMILNRQGLVFVGQRIDSAADAWQMPQGGIDPGEDAEIAALREVEEEAGISPDLIRILARAPHDLLYDLPPEMIGKLWKGKYRGQRQSWFLARFLGEDSAINIHTAHPEFRAWKWVEADDLVRLIVPFKRKLYADVVAAFAPLIGPEA